MPLFLRNPHSVLAALLSRPQEVLEVQLSSHKSEGWERVEELASRKKVPLRKGGKPSASQKDSPDARASGCCAKVKEKPGISVEELFLNAKTRANGKGLWLALDCLQDPQNVG